MMRDIAAEMGIRKHIHFCDHHFSHAASAFFPSPFNEAAILTIDGVGEWSTTTYGVGRGNTIELIEQIRFPNSLGLLYSAFTYYTGFKINSGEYKLMGLAPYGSPKHADLIRDKLIRIGHDGAVAMVSHLPYLVAGALAVAAREAGPLALKLAGPGLEDMTRLAQFPFDVQGEVSRRNARLPQAAARLSSHLARVLEGIATSPEATSVALEEARAAREALYPTAHQEGSAR